MESSSKDIVSAAEDILKNEDPFEEDQKRLEEWSDDWIVWAGREISNNPLSVYRLFKRVVEQLPKIVKLSDDGVIGTLQNYYPTTQRTLKLN